MTPERYRQIGELYHAALEVDAAERPAFLARACAGDEELRRDVDSLIVSHEQSEDFIAAPALSVAAEMLATRQTDALEGQMIGRYRVHSLIGAGGMGRVHLAEDTALSRRVALKLLPEHFTNDKNQLQRFHQEARAASALNHPNIVTVYEVGVWQGRDFIATEFVEGVTLRTRMRGRGLPLAAAVDIALQVAGALTAAHAAGIVHRDIKPENIMIRPDGLVKVLDFGIAKYAGPRRDKSSESWVKTATGVVIGTTAYMSPEQARGQEVDARADIWSLGVILYEMVARRLPFQGKTPTDRVAAILEREPEPLGKRRGIPHELEEIIKRALVKDKELRYARAADFAEDLRRLRPALGEERAFRFALPRPAHGLFSSRRGRSLALAALLLVIVAAAAALYFRLGVGGRGQPDSRQLGAAIDSIAVLPLANSGGSDEIEYLSDGITESLISNLSQLANLKVMSRNSVFRFKGQAVDAQQVSRSLGVRAVMMGNLKRIDDQLVINVELIDARDGSVIWTHQYMRKMADVIALQTNVAQDITENLRLKLSGAQQQQLAKRHTDNVEAYDLYLKGLYFLSRNREEDFRKSIEYFQRAIDLDPNFGLAYAGLAYCYNSQTLYSEVPPSESIPRARAAALKALDLDETLSEAHTALAFIKFAYDRDWSGTESELQRALEINPNYALAHSIYSGLLTALGRFDEAIAKRKAALELDPLSPVIRSAFGWTLYFAHRYDSAIEECRETLVIDEDFFRARLYIGLAYEQKGMYEQAIAELKKALSLSEDNVEILSSMAHVYAASGNRAEAQQILNKLNELSKQKHVDPYFVALIYVGLGQKDQAFEWLEKAHEYGSIMLVWLKIEPRLDSIRSDSRYPGLVRRVGLPQ
ncbi:MAG TPA: protein kinase [Blastocatellia bacterium]|jgi:TolB-like protein